MAQALRIAQIFCLSKKEERQSSFLFLLFYSLLPLQTLQPLHQSFERPFCSFRRRRIREANPVVAEGREERAGHNRDAVIFGEVLSQRFAIRPAFGFEIFTDIHKSVIALADDVLHSAFGE